MDLQGFDITKTGTERSAMRELWTRGGFPRSYLAESEEDSLAWCEGFVRTLGVTDAGFWSTYSGAELDVFLVRGNRRIGIECTWL